MDAVGTGSVFQMAILHGTSEGVANSLKNAQDKCQDVIRLEQSMAETHQMFVDLSILVR